VSTITFDPGLADPDPCTLITVAIANGSPRDLRSCAVPKTSSNIFNKKDARHYGPHKSEMAPKKISRKDAKRAKIKTGEGIVAKRRKKHKKRFSPYLLFCVLCALLRPFLPARKPWRLSVRFRGWLPNSSPGGHRMPACNRRSRNNTSRLDTQKCNRPYSAPLTYRIPDRWPPPAVGRRPGSYPL
jgi:hypothetical protein